MAEGLLAFFAFFLIVHAATIAIAAFRIKPVKDICPPPEQAEPVSLIIPLCGLENFSVETLRSAFGLTYPCHELIFCIQSAHDPIIPLVEREMRAHPDVAATILIGDDVISQNPKLNNCVKGWNRARHDWIILADSNVLMPKDYICRLLRAWRANTGLVCSTPQGTRAQNFAAFLEEAFLNSYQAKWQFVAEWFGLGFAQGKSMLWHRSILADVGGIACLGREIAEDATATKIVREKGLKVHLVDNPFEQPLGARAFAAVWARQLRWARLRRVTFPLYFVPEVFSGAFFPLLALTLGLSILAPHYTVLGVLLAGALWYGLEAALEGRAGWPMSAAGLGAKICRDALLPLLFLASWCGDEFVWHGNRMSVAKPAVKRACLQRAKPQSGFAHPANVITALASHLLDIPDWMKFKGGDGFATLKTRLEAFADGLRSQKG